MKFADSLSGKVLIVSRLSAARHGEDARSGTGMMVRGRAGRERAHRAGQDGEGPDQDGRGPTGLGRTGSARTER